MKMYKKLFVAITLAFLLVSVSFLIRAENAEANLVSLSARAVCVADNCRTARATGHATVRQGGVRVDVGLTHNGRTVATTGWVSSGPGSNTASASTRTVTANNNHQWGAGANWSPGP